MDTSEYWVWWETEYPEDGSHGPYASQEEADEAARECDVTEWETALLTPEQIAQREANAQAALP